MGGISADDQGEVDRGWTGRSRLVKSFQFPPSRRHLGRDLFTGVHQFTQRPAIGLDALSSTKHRPSASASGMGCRYSSDGRLSLAILFPDLSRQAKSSVYASTCAHMGPRPAGSAGRG